MVMTSRVFIATVGILVTLLPGPCRGFQSSHSIVELRRPTLIESLRDNGLESVDESPFLSQICRRRQVVLTSLAIVGTTFNVSPSSSIAKETYDIDCLSDLPPLAADSVRIYLCRHGETENNRLGLVQGARIDPPINTRGRSQAQRMGDALSRAVTKPSIFLHSPLLRATETTELAAAAMSQAPRVKAESSLAEVDFGQVAEGRPVAEVRGGMVQTYASWAAGDIDQRMAGGGENGREVFFRVENALHSLVEQAAESENNCLAAVAHSSYLRVLLLCLQDKSLLEYSVMQQGNCCINVLDLKKDGATRTLTGRSILVGTRAPSDFAMKTPLGNVVRVNEIRHLIGVN